MKPRVTSIRLVGRAYTREGYSPGFAQVETINDDGERQTFFVPERAASGFAPVLDFIEDRADTKKFRERLAEWVRTGVMPKGNKLAINEERNTEL